MLINQEKIFRLFLHYNFSQEPLHNGERLKEREEFPVLLLLVCFWCGPQTLSYVSMLTYTLQMYATSPHMLLTLSFTTCCSVSHTYV